MDRGCGRGDGVVREKGGSGCKGEGFERGTWGWGWG